MTDKRDERRYGRPRALATFVPRLTRPVLRGFSRAEATLLMDWEEIVGPEIAPFTQPIKLTFPKRDERLEATLHLRVDPAMAQDLQHSGDLLVERINTHFGYSLIARLRLQQAPVTSRQRRPPLGLVSELPPERAQGLQKRLSNIEDPGLREALERLARAVASRKTP